MINNSFLKSKPTSRRPSLLKLFTSMKKCKKNFLILLLGISSFGFSCHLKALDLQAVNENVEAYLNEQQQIEEELITVDNIVLNEESIYGGLSVVGGRNLSKWRKRKFSLVFEEKPSGNMCWYKRINYNTADEPDLVNSFNENPNKYESLNRFALSKDEILDAFKNPINQNSRRMRFFRDENQRNPTGLIVGTAFVVLAPIAATSVGSTLTALPTVKALAAVSPAASASVATLIHKSFSLKMFFETLGIAAIGFNIPGIEQLIASLTAPASGLQNSLSVNQATYLELLDTEISQEDNDAIFEAINSNYESTSTEGDKWRALREFSYTIQTAGTLKNFEVFSDRESCSN